MRIVDQNLYYSKFLRRNLERLNKFQPDILVFQEFSLSKYRNVKSTPFHEYQLIHPKTCNSFTNAILTKVPYTNWGELHLNDSGELIDTVNGMAHDTIILWADFETAWGTFSIYNCHFSVARSGFNDRSKMLKTAVDHAATKANVFILGDMNTTIPSGKLNRFVEDRVHHCRIPTFEQHGELFDKNEKYYFNKIANNLGYTDLLDINKNTWRFPFTSLEICNLKLDWLLQKNIKHAKAFIVEKTPLYLDHKTLVIDL